MNKIQRFVTIILGLALFSCHTPEDNINSKNNENNKIFSFLESSGFNVNEMEINGNEIIYENDIILNRDFILSQIGDRKKQRRTGFVSLNNVSNISIKVDTDVPPDWKTALESAVIAWNAIPSTRVHMYIIHSGSPDITVKYQHIGSGDVLAHAYSPVANKVGSQLRINSSGFWVDSNKKKNAMAHELGHTIGLGHTDWLTIGTHIVGTWVSDPLSVMNSANGTWRGFSYNDMRAVQILYP
jgi:hypothetical protein